MSASAQPSGLTPDTAEDLINRIGTLTRTLRDSMRELGLDRHIVRAAKQIPDARDRLGYVAKMTERAAERALNAIDVAQPLQENLATRAKELDAQWSQCSEGAGQTPPAALLADTQAYLKEVPVQCSAINQQLMEIMMAQDFQDLTGQVIKKMMEVVHELEMQLVRVLLDNVPMGKRIEQQQVPAALASSAAVSAGTAEDGAEDEKEPFLHGPQYKPETPPEALSEQAQVDDLLSSLGF